MSRILEVCIIRNRITVIRIHITATGIPPSGGFTFGWGGGGGSWKNWPVTVGISRQYLSL